MFRDAVPMNRPGQGGPWSREVISGRLGLRGRGLGERELEDGVSCQRDDAVEKWTVVMLR